MSKFEIAVRLYKSYLITEALKEFKGNQCAAARQLGIHRNTLGRSMKSLGIDSKARFNPSAVLDPMTLPQKEQRRA